MVLHRRRHFMHRQLQPADGTVSAPLGILTGRTSQGGPSRAVGTALASRGRRRRTLSETRRRDGANMLRHGKTGAHTPGPDGVFATPAAIAAGMNIGSSGSSNNATAHHPRVITARPNARTEVAAVVVAVAVLTAEEAALHPPGTAAVVADTHPVTGVVAAVVAIATKR
jgi:hypothetical protein